MILLEDNDTHDESKFVRNDYVASKTLFEVKNPRVTIIEALKEYNSLVELHSKAVYKYYNNKIYIIMKVPIHYYLKDKATVMDTFYT